MALVETFGWIAFQATVLFLALLGLSRLVGTRGGPGLFKVLWLFFFLKLLVPVGVFHPEPVPIPMDIGAFQRTEERNALTGQDFAEADPLPQVFWNPGEAILAVWGAGTLTIWALMIWGYRRAVRKPSAGPAAVGILRPRILLPRDFSTAFTFLEQELILNHESAHLKAKDPLQLIFCQAVTGLYWWLPPVWWAQREFAAAMESACDFQVLRNRPADEVRVYGDLLIRMSSIPAGSGLAWFAGSFGPLKRRVTAMVAPRKVRGPLAWVLAALLATGISGLALTPPEIRWNWPLSANLAVVSPASQSSWMILETKTASSVSALAPGVVREVPGIASHSYLVLDHGDGYVSEYAGLTIGSGVTEGVAVSRNQILGTSDPRCFTVRLLHFGFPVDLNQIFSRQLAQATLSHWGTQAILWPLPRGVGRESAEFGLAVHPFTGQEYFHTGTDWSAPAGTPVTVMDRGTVKTVGRGIPTYGNYILVDHGNGRTSLYSQLEKIQVVAGQKVEAGDQLGKVAANFSATGPHLHWEVSLGGYFLDPMKISYR